MAAATSAREAIRTAPGPRGVPFLGVAGEALRDPMRFFVSRWQQYGDVMGAPVGPYDYIAVTDPDAIHHMLVENPKNYEKSPNYRGLRVVLGNGLVTSEGEFWQRQRRLAQPAFHRERLASFRDSMVADTRDMLARWRSEDASLKEAGALPRPLDMHREMTRLTFRIVGHTLFSVDLDAESEALGPVISAALEGANEMSTAVLPLPYWVPTPTHVRLRRAVARLDELVLRIIGERRAIAGTSQEPNDLLAMLMGARDEQTREQMTDRQLRDEVLTLVLAGHETTANLLSWTWYLLSRHPDFARRLQTEVRTVLGERPPSMEDLAQLKLTRAIIEESMRLFPPVWAFERRALADDVLGGYHVPKGALVGVCTYALHRHPDHWDNPEGFDPERFFPERAKGRHRFAYMPFGGGPRICIGNGFAMMEAQIIVAMMAQSYRLDLAAGHEVVPEATVTLRPKGGMLMTRRPLPSQAC